MAAETTLAADVGTGLVAANHVCKTYATGESPGRLVLDHIDFTLKEGEIVAILGKSGSGKSTFLRVLAGLTEPSEGRVAYRGRAGARHRHGVPDLRALPVAHRAGQCRAGPGGA